MSAQIAITDFRPDLARFEVVRIQVGEVTIFKTSVGEMDNNAYLLVDSRAPQRSLLIDAAADADHLLAVSEQVGATIATVVTTHSHADHQGALAELISRTGAEHLTAAEDAADISEPAQRVLSDGDHVSFGADINLEAFILHGHTKGGVALALTGGAGAGTIAASAAAVPTVTHLFVGDSLFPGGVGKTATAAEFERLLSDVEAKIFRRYPADTMVHPGHGNSTTVGEQAPQVEQWRQRGW